MVSSFRTTPKILMGPGAVAQLGECVRGLRGTRCFVVTDPGLARAGILEAVEGALAAAGVETAAFPEVEPEPPIPVAQRCAEALRGFQADCVVGVGGGSSLDVAKVASVAAVHGEQRLTDFFGVDAVPGPGLPLVAVPTTAGTGSEVTPIAILSDEAAQLKKGIVSDFLLPRAAVLDPELTLGLPPPVTAATGLDALIHAVEAFTSVRASSLTDLLAVQAIRLIHRNLRTAYARGADLEARARLLEGSLLAGMAFANAGVTAVHAFAYPLGARFHVPHGVANSVMLLSVLRFNLIGDLPKFARLAEAFDTGAGGSPRARAESALDAIDELIRDVGVPTRLRDLGVPEEALDDMAAGAMEVTRLLANNPRTIRLEDAAAIYRDAY
ncbi:MAG: iron-containing alcohol dehydrogenase [Deferrisomatales bacterium]